MSAHRWVGWDEYHRLIEALARIVHQSGYRFDHVLCLARGGLRVGDVFSRIFKTPLHILSTSAYRDAGGTQQGDLTISNHITSTAGTLAGRVLLIDDLVDSGITLDRVRTYLSKNFSAVADVRSAVLWYKACSITRPDYYVEYLPDNPWIHQPFEAYDDMVVDQLGQ